MTPEVPWQVVREAGVVLTAEDAALGYRRGWLRAPEVVRWAEDALARGEDDASVIALAGLGAAELGEVGERLDDLVPDAYAGSSEVWLYLVLLAVYGSRGRIDDPLGVVEQVYADFEYPEAIAPLVRYMPAPPGAPLGEAALLDQWKDWLDQERTVRRDGAG
jgi:hypothetical protein